MIKPEYQHEMFPHWMEVPIRFRDLDPLNHVNNAIFSTFYEEARIAFISESEAFVQGMNNGFSFVLANINIDFVKPVTYPVTLLIGTGLKKLGNSSITSIQAIYRADTKVLVSVAEASGVWFDLKKQRPARVPELKDINDFIIDFED